MSVQSPTHVDTKVTRVAFKKPAHGHNGSAQERALANSLPTCKVCVQNDGPQNFFRREPNSSTAAPLSSLRSFHESCATKVSRSCTPKRTLCSLSLACKDRPPISSGGSRALSLACKDRPPISAGGSRALSLGRKDRPPISAGGSRALASNGREFSRHHGRG
jgi:hypothetical protein